MTDLLDRGEPPLEHLPPEPSRPDEPPMLDYAPTRSKQPEDTPFYVRFLLLLLSVPAILIGIPLGIGGAVMVWRWMMGTVSADANDGFRFIIASGILVSGGMLGVRAGLRSDKFQ